MTVLSCELDIDIADLTEQRAARRARSLSKDRAEYKKRLAASPHTHRKVIATPAGSEPATPHRSARVATRASLAKCVINTSSDMPQISMGRAGTRQRRLQKPSVSATLSSPKPSQQTLDENPNASWQASPAECTYEELREIQAKLEEEGRILIEQVRLQAIHKAQQVTTEHAEADSAQPVGGIQNAHDNDLVGADASMIEDADVAPPPSEIDDSSTPSCMSLDDHIAFPAYVSSQSKVESHMQRSNAEDGFEALTLEMLRPPPTDDSQTPRDESELPTDWIFVSAVDADQNAKHVCVGAPEPFDGQQPRHTLAKKTASKQMKTTGNSQERVFSIDWSQAGIPLEVKRQILHANTNAGHQGLYTKRQPSREPIRVMRAVSAGSSKRQESTPKSPSSRSKSCAKRQASRGR